jgi:hypothetical protein
MTPALLAAFAVAIVGWVLKPIVAAQPLPSEATLDGTPVCPRCGPRPEGDARYCSECGARTSRAPAT